MSNYQIKSGIKWLEEHKHIEEAEVFENKIDKLEIIWILHLVILDIMQRVLDVGILVFRIILLVKIFYFSCFMV